MAMEVSPEYLRSVVERILEQEPEARVVGIQGPSTWAGEEEIEVNTHRFRIRAAASVLEAREVLTAAEEDETRVVLLTGLDAKDLGADVHARLARTRLHSANVWESVRQLFKARIFAPSLGDRCVAEALVEHAPPGGYPPVPSGVLDREAMWASVLHFVLGMPDERTDLTTLLRWSLDPEGRRRFGAIGDDLRRAVEQRVEATVGSAGTSVLRFVGEMPDRGAFALAVTCDVLFPAGEDEGSTGKVLGEARVRLERHHRGEKISVEDGRRIGQAAAEVVADLRAQGGGAELERALERADELLSELHAEDQAALGSITWTSFRHRLSRFARAIHEALDAEGGPPTERCRSALSAVQGHQMSKIRPAVVRRAEMAMRLVQWLASGTSPSEDAGFAALARAYPLQGSFTDRAREELVSGEDESELTRVYDRLETEVFTRRREENRIFAGAAAGWISTVEDPVLIETALDRLVAPLLGAAGPVLLVLLDGMSWAIAHDLLEDLARTRPGILPWTLGESGSRPITLLATAPSVTEFSRTSFFSGRLCRGKDRHEKKAFREHEGLVGKCQKQHPPILFHKGELTEGSRGVLSQSVEAAIASPRKKLVAVVINAIDDRLAGAQQVRDRWTVDHIRPLGTLLQAAFDAGRTVVLTSDHGHVYHRTSSFQPKEDETSTGGDRWRLGADRVAEGEIRLDGPRVEGTGVGTEITVPWDEEIRYAPAAHNGYHGGLTPQEMLVPFLILSEKDLHKSGLGPVDLEPPSWWRLAPEPRALPSAPIREEPVESTPTPTPAEPPPIEKAVPEPDWLDDLFRCDTFEAQRTMARRHAVGTDELRQALLTLLEQGGAMTPTAFARSLSLPALRLDGFLARAQRLLNIDGYEVLLHDREREIIELDVNLLKRQFDL